MIDRICDAHAPPVNSAEEEAARWLMRIESVSEEQEGAIDIDAYAKQDEAFGDWLEANPAHRIEVLRMLHTWRRADRLSALNSPSLSQPGPRQWRNRWTKISGIAAAAALALAIIPVALMLRSDDLKGYAYETLVGSREAVRLADGSRLELNSNTRVTTEVTRDERTVVLEKGEAFFEVARDETRPFKVIAGRQIVTVLGTKFSVHRRGNGIEVAVTEGRVQIDEAGDAEDLPPTVVAAGDIVTAEEGAILVASNDMASVARELSWRQGYVIFDKMPLAEAAMEFNRYNRTELVIADDAIGAIEISGRFTSENVDAFARLLSDGFDLTVQRERNKIIISG